MQYSIIKTPNNEILAINTWQNKLIYGGTDKVLYMYTDNNSIKLTSHNKSIKCISTYNNMFACGSYDCTASIFKDGIFYDTLEGPESEIKGIAINDTYIALATRAKTVWISKLDLEIDSILEDHLFDIKGVSLYKDKLFTYSYDNTIKIYTKNDSDWVLMHNIEDISTIWKICHFKDLLIYCTDDGFIKVLNEEYLLIKEIRASLYPIYDFTLVNDKICFIQNRDNLCLFNMNFESPIFISKLGRINCLHFNEENNVLYVGQNGFIKVIKM